MDKITTVETENSAKITVEDALTSNHSYQLANHEFRISTLETSSQYFQLKNLRSSSLELKEPLSVILISENIDSIAKCPDLDIYGVGETEQEALSDLSKAIEEFYFDIKDEREESLGPEMLSYWRFMKKILHEI